MSGIVIYFGDDWRNYIFIVYKYARRNIIVSSRFPYIE